MRIIIRLMLILQFLGAIVACAPVEHITDTQRVETQVSKQLQIIIPSVTPYPKLILNMSFDDFGKKYNQTAINQQENWLISLVGREVTWSGKVEEIDSSSGYWVFFIPIPKMEYSKVGLVGAKVNNNNAPCKVGDKLYFTGIIYSIYPSKEGSAPSIEVHGSSINVESSSVNMSLEEFGESLTGLTTLQEKAFLESINGKTVAWAGEVAGISGDGTVTVFLPHGIFQVIYLDEVPYEKAIKLNGSDKISFIGTLITTNGIHVKVTTIFN